MMEPTISSPVPITEKTMRITITRGSTRRRPLPSRDAARARAATSACFLSVSTVAFELDELEVLAVLDAVLEDRRLSRLFLEPRDVSFGA